MARREPRKYGDEHKAEVVASVRSTVIKCPTVAFAAEEPVIDQVAPVAQAQALNGRGRRPRWHAEPLAARTITDIAAKRTMSARFRFEGGCLA